MNKQQIGVIGLAVMGKNIALNIAEKGYTVSVYNRSDKKIRALVEESPFKNLVGTYSLEDFIASLEVPRKIILMIKAGEPVDYTLDELIPYLEKGDIVMDGGNSYFKDTIRRNKKMAGLGFHFMGVGISGGEEGARNGPAIMPGGSQKVYTLIQPILEAISAKVENEPCCSYIGEDGAGHFVKMVHNGIEYADMQLICEAYFIMKKALHLTAPDFHTIFKKWNEGELNSYLIEITADIFTKKDAETGEYLVDKILDVAGQKGTGKWTSQVALDLGAVTPTITEAVFARYISAIKEERVEANQIITFDEVIPEIEDKEAFIESIRRALYASKMCAYAQGFSLMREASKHYQWDLPLGEIAKIFRGGCIIRAQFLNKIKEAYDKDLHLANLLLDEYFNESIQKYQKDWRKVVAIAVETGIPVPAFSSALSYFDSYRLGELPMNLLQAQRDYFGAHTYERIDKEGTFHTQW